MTEYYIHTTSNKDRWDTIAAKYYGNCYEITPIIEENPHLPISEEFESSVEVKVPIKETELKTTGLPNWKKG